MQPWNRFSYALATLTILSAATAPSAWSAGGKRAVSSEPLAGAFAPLSELDPHQQELLSAIPGASGGESAWQTWAAANDGTAAAFLAITHALKQTEVRMSDGRMLRALDLVRSIKEFRGDRIIVETRRDLFEDWMNDGGAFDILRADGKDETAHVDFDNGGPGGSVHDGFDVQGYTSSSRVPRIQWNYRFADGVADIDLDGYAPLKFGWIPNPHHKTWENSDVRYWPNDYFKKFGPAGFSVTK